MATYRYLAADLRTNTILADLPLSGVTFDLLLNGAGSLRADLAITDPLVKRIDPLTATQPGRTALYVDRDGVLLWGGIIWTRSYEARSGRLQIGGSEFESYLFHRRITTDTVFAGVDQLRIAQSLVTTAQQASGGDIGIQVGTETSGVLRDRTYYAYELKNVGEALRQLSAVANGFDFSIDVAYVAGAPTKTLTLSYPRRGQIVSRSGWLWEFPGNVEDYSWPEDSTSQAMRAYATSSGVGPGQLIASSTVTRLLDSGYPLLEAVTAYGDISIATTLQAHADADAAALADPVTIPVLRVRADQDPMVGSYITGDELRLRINDDRWPRNANGTSGVDGAFRIIKITVQPPGSGSQEHVEITLGGTV